MVDFTSSCSRLKVSVLQVMHVVQYTQGLDIPATHCVILSPQRLQEDVVLASTLL